MRRAALLVAAVAAADNATHTVIATVLNERYVPLFELWHPHFAAATDSDAVELVVACLDPAAAAAVRRLDKRARTLDATTGTRHDVWAARLAKVLAVAHLVNEERAGSRRPVVLSDVDAFWLASPIASLRRIDAALVFSLDRVPTGASAPAGFDTNRGVTLCSGFFLARPTEKTTALLVAWRRRIVAAGSDQVAANALYDDVGGKGFAVIREEVQRCPSAVPAVWHPYSPSRVETKVKFWRGVLAKIGNRDKDAFAGVRCSWPALRGPGRRGIAPRSAAAGEEALAELDRRMGGVA